jgi:hypothetical protein
MNSKQASKKLKISVRSLQRLTKKHNLTVLYQRGKSGKQEAIYDPDEIDRLRDTLAQPTEREPTPPESDSLSPATIPDASRQSQLVALIAHTVSETIRQSAPALLPPAPDNSPADSVRLSEKLLLSIPEAAAISGMSADKLRAAVHDGKLKTIESIGRGLGKVRRSDLDLFISKLK